MLEKTKNKAWWILKEYWSIFQCIIVFRIICISHDIFNYNDLVFIYAISLCEAFFILNLIFVIVKNVKKTHTKNMVQLQAALTILFSVILFLIYW